LTARLHYAASARIGLNEPDALVRRQRAYIIVTARRPSEIGQGPKRRAEISY
jgi:hypothetical protein